jgi:hypothetical protein
MADRLKSKKKCCGDSPRCRRCKVVCKRLAKRGYYERDTKRVWIVKGKVPKRAMKAARAR